MFPRALLCFLLPCLAGGLVAFVWTPLDRHQTEEYFELAQAPPGAESSLFRPPGYVAFLRGVGELSGGLSEGKYAPVYLAQGVLLGLAAVGFFLAAARWLPLSAASLLALAFGCHPLMVLLAGYVHYDLLHVTFLVWLSLAVMNALAGARPSLGWALAAGLLAGLTTLIRPMTLLFPAVLLLMLCWRRGPDGQRRWLAAVVCLAAMGLTVAPRTWENYQRTGRFIPVNAQSGSALWPMTETALRPTSDNFPWVPLWSVHGVSLLEPKLGADAKAPDVFFRRPLEVDDVLRARARAQLAAQPGVYLNNVFHNFVFFWTGDSRQLVRAFLFYQPAEHSPPPENFSMRYFEILSAALHLLGAAGLVLAFWRREDSLCWLGAALLTLWLAHSLVYLDARYLYAEIPFLFWFSAYALRASLPARWPRAEVAAGGLLAASFLGLVLVLI